jgi:hypothetical protein
MFDMFNLYYISRVLLRWIACFAMWLTITHVSGYNKEGTANEDTKTASKPNIIVVKDNTSAKRWKIDNTAVTEMITEGLLQLTKKPDINSAWLSLVSPRDTIGIKVNAVPGKIGGTRIEVVDTVVKGLLKAQVPPDHIVIWDASIKELSTAGFDNLAKRHNIRIAGSKDAGWDKSVVYDSPIVGTLITGDAEFKSGEEITSRKSYLSRLISQELTRIISIQPLINHNKVGVSGHLVGLTRGSVDNNRRFGISNAILVESIPNIIALEDKEQKRHIGDKIALCITDALYFQYFGQSKALLHYTEPLGQLRFSTDPVALDILSIEELEQQRQRLKIEFQPPRSILYKNATWLQIGESDPAKLRVEYFGR